jgi:hypothetical protein
MHVGVVGHGFARAPFSGQNAELQMLSIEEENLTPAP